MSLTTGSRSVPRDLKSQALLLLPVKWRAVGSVKAQPLHKRWPAELCLTVCATSIEHVPLARPSWKTRRCPSTNRCYVRWFCLARCLGQVCEAASQYSRENIVGRETAPSLPRWSFGAILAELRLQRCESSLKRPDGWYCLEGLYAFLLRNCAESCTTTSISQSTV